MLMLSRRGAARFLENSSVGVKNAPQTLLAMWCSYILLVFTASSFVGARGKRRRRHHYARGDGSGIDFPVDSATEWMLLLLFVLDYLFPKLGLQFAAMYFVVFVLLLFRLRCLPGW